MSTAPVPSPCVSVCRMHAPTGWCEGCFRTLDEIAAWSGMDDAHKRAVWLELGRRRVVWRARAKSPLEAPSTIDKASPP